MKANQKAPAGTLPVFLPKAVVQRLHAAEDANRIQRDDIASAVLGCLVEDKRQLQEFIADTYEGVVP